MLSVINPINQKLIKLVENNGFIYGNEKTDLIIREIIYNVLNRIGKSYSKALIYQMCNLYNLSENELLSNYELFEKSIVRVLGKTAFPIILRIKKELLKYVVIHKLEISVKDILDPRFNIPIIIDKLAEYNNFEVICQNLAKQNRIVLFCSKDKYKKKVIKELLWNSKERKEMIRIVISLSDHFNQVRYFETDVPIDSFYMITENNLENIFKIKNIEFLNFDQYSNSSIQIFYFLDNKILNESNTYKIFQRIEEKLSNLYFRNKEVQVCCIFDVSKSYSTERELKFLTDFLTPYNIVIIDEPLVIYEKFEVQNKNIK